MVLIDTSCWTHALRRKGDATIRARVHELLVAEQAAWCEMVRLELWHGVANDWDEQLLRALEEQVTSLPITADVWQRAVFIAGHARHRGLTVPVTDLLIFACANVHGVEVQHFDRHFDLLKQLQA